MSLKSFSPFSVMMMKEMMISDGSDVDDDKDDAVQWCLSIKLVNGDAHVGVYGDCKALWHHGDHHDQDDHHHHDHDDHDHDNGHHENHDDHDDHDNHVDYDGYDDQRY